jgi:hypothetical protein
VVQELAAGLRQIVYRSSAVRQLVSTFANRHEIDKKEDGQQQDPDRKESDHDKPVTYFRNNAPLKMVALHRFLRHHSFNIVVIND